MSKPTVGFAIPTIPPRKPILARAVRSVIDQSYPVSQISIVTDIDRTGAGPTRNRAKNALTTEWTCFLDDDDELYSMHVQTLIEHQAETGADIVFPWFDVAGGTDPFPQFFGRQWDPEVPHMFPITLMIRTEVARAYDFKEPEFRPEADAEDWAWYLAMNDAGVTFSHVPVRTWRWHHDSLNTSGLPNRW